MANEYLPGVVVIPSSLEVTAITNAYPMEITVEAANSASSDTYVVGMAVRLNIPYSYGMFQANNLVGTILSISDSQFTLDLDSRLFDVFTIPGGDECGPATISPNGSRNLTINNNNLNNVPFRNLNNIGN